MRKLIFFMSIFAFSCNNSYNCYECEIERIFDEEGNKIEQKYNSVECGKPKEILKEHPDSVYRIKCDF